MSAPAEKGAGAPLRRALCFLVQCTWGLPQTLVGLCFLAANAGKPHFGFRAAIVTQWKRTGCCALGPFVFISEAPALCAPGAAEWPRLLVHEYGHTLQSLALGPLYLPLISLPSAVWYGLPALRRLRAARGINYYAFYTERWADRWGAAAAGRPGMDAEP